MLLRLRGVRASDEEPEVTEALRHALFSETLAPEFAACKEVLDTPFSKGMSPDDRGRLGKAKLAAKDQLARLRVALMLDVED